MPLERDMERRGVPGGGLPDADRFLGRFRRSWRRAQLLRAAALGLCAFLAAGVALVALDLLLSLPAGARSLLRGLPFLAAVAVLVLRLRRVIPAPPARLLALRAEEEFPELEKLLSTAVEAPPPGGRVGELFRQRLAERLARLEARARVPSRAGSLLGAASGAAVALALLVVAGGPQEVWERWVRPFSGVVSVAGWSAEAGEGVPPAAFGALLVEGVRWTVTPPAYTGLPPVEVEDVAVLSAFPGSRIELAADAPPPGVELAVRVVGPVGGTAGGGSLRTAQGDPLQGTAPDGRLHPSAPGVPVEGAVEGATWRGAWTVLPEHRGVSVELVRNGEVAARRVFPLLLRQDSAPDVRLLLPEEDLVVALPRGEVAVRAEARDDLGIRGFALSWIHTSGSGESFSFQQGEWPWEEVSGGEGSRRGEALVDLQRVGLQPGDVLHLRAVATDGNDVTGPGEGVSNTRVIRVAREGEEGEITTLIGFPLELEREPILSQRMLILMTEELRDRGLPAGSDPLMQESRRIADEQGRLRDVVGEEIYVRLAAEEDPLAAADPLAPAGHLHDHGARGASGGPATASGARPGVPDSVQVRVVPGGEEALERALRIARTLEEASRATGTGMPDEGMHLHDASPILDMNPLKLRAFNAMWAAERELRQGALGAALVHQYRALEFIQEMREENRVFARGRQTVAPIDVEGARGTGRMRDVAPRPREPQPPPGGVEEVLAALEGAMASLPTLEPSAASVELGGVALRMLEGEGIDPAAPALVSEAATAAGEGDPERAAALLVRARAALAPVEAGGVAPPLAAPASPVAAEYFRRLGEGVP